ncbi:hypothetical protein PFY12_14520 [Chryseobacterium camelliae]|uniref:Uncharacterized protein n=1 Tax=Chryseobacterium camelliae TaxID=1265445 RepID=A0ABY7QM49_9FLAO|nr:hypothetical protein [Chryseobacterium camelliae]WBV60239.1 hypothetical protein PFY12_14520 [Chryseobacterium camelliae]
MLLFFGIGIFFFVKFIQAVSRSAPKPKNHYIETHQKKINDDYLYDEYLKFCKEKGELPMEKSGFQELRMKEEAMKRKINNAIR